MSVTPLAVDRHPATDAAGWMDNLRVAVITA